MQLKQKDGISIKPLLTCLNDIKARLALNFLNSNDKKTEVLAFGTSGPCESSSVDLRPLDVYVKPGITDLGFKLDSDFKLGSQVRACGEVQFLSFKVTD